MAIDKHGRDVFLADTSYALALAQENFKDIRFTSPRSSDPATDHQNINHPCYQCTGGFIHKKALP